jgi:hypothetical protein
MVFGKLVLILNREQHINEVTLFFAMDLLRRRVVVDYFIKQVVPNPVHLICPGTQNPLDNAQPLQDWEAFY